jgi:O-methyltransferase involved in polyketide biosynthesis
MTAPLRHVSDTALWVAMYRALESERPDALFRDPWARHLAGAKPVCAHEDVAADLTDAGPLGALLERASRGGRSAMAVTEGLLVYLTSGQVRDLARQIYAATDFRWWLIDLARRTGGCPASFSWRGPSRPGRRDRSA